MTFDCKYQTTVYMTFNSTDVMQLQCYPELKGKVDYKCSMGDMADTIPDKYWYNEWHNPVGKFIIKPSLKSIYAALVMWSHSILRQYATKYSLE